MLRLGAIGKEKSDVLKNLMQKYLYEMTLYYENRLNDQGDYEYPYLPLYFSDPDRQAYFFYDDEELIGFVLVNRLSFTGEEIDNSLAEFTILPMFRKHGYGMKAFSALLSLRPGIWQLKYSTKNKTGAAFWQKVKALYNGVEAQLEDGEIALTLR